MEEGDEAITGAQLAQMSEEELNRKVRHISVYARVSPEDKIRIVKALAGTGRNRFHDGRRRKRCARAEGGGYRLRHGHNRYGRGKGARRI